MKRKLSSLMIMCFLLSGYALSQQQGTLHVTGLNGGFETGVKIENPTSSNGTITLTGTYPDGQTQTITQQVASNGGLAGSAQDLFPDRQDAQGNAIRVSHISVPKSSLIVTATYVRSGSPPTTVRPSPEGTAWIINPSGETYTDGFAFVNTSTEPTSVIIEYYDEDGNLLYEQPIIEHLEPQEKALRLITRHEQGSGYYRIKTTGKGAIISLSFSPDQKVVMPNPAEPVSNHAPDPLFINHFETDVEGFGSANTYSDGTFQIIADSGGSDDISYGPYSVILSENSTTCYDVNFTNGPLLGSASACFLWTSPCSGWFSFQDGEGSWPLHRFMVTDGFDCSN